MTHLPRAATGALVATFLIASPVLAAPNTGSTTLAPNSGDSVMAPGGGIPDTFIPPPTEPGNQTQTNPTAPGIEQMPDAGLTQTEFPDPLSGAGDGGAGTDDGGAGATAPNTSNRPRPGRTPRPNRPGNAAPAPTAPAPSYRLICDTPVGYCQGVTPHQIASGTRCLCGSAEGRVR